MDNMLDYQSVSHKMDPPLIRGGGGGSGGAMVLGKLPVPGHPTNLD